MASSPNHILIVEDQDEIRTMLCQMVQALGHETESARDGVEALAKLKLDVDLVLLDVTMPGMDGFEVARRIRQDPKTRDLPIIMVTGLEGKEHRLRAVEAGANDFISKPADMIELQVRMTSLLKMKEAQDANKRHSEELKQTVEQRTAALREALDNMVEAQRTTQGAHLDTIHRLALAAEYKDDDTATHILRMSRYCTLLGESLNLPPGEVEILRVASPLHDVGKMGIPDAVLLKPGKLTEQEWEIMKQHPSIGAHILSGSPSELLQTGEAIAISHHERWDGSGYPNGLTGTDIPLLGRICAVADVFDALTSERPYKEAFPTDKSVEIMQEGRGKHFDPDLLDRFVERLDEVIAIRTALCGA